MSLGRQDYLEGALARHRESIMLYREQEYAGSIYLSGRAVESLLRCLMIRHNVPMTVGHSLREHLKALRSRLRLVHPWSETIENAVNEIDIVWRNDMRYSGARRLMRLLKSAGRSARLGGRPIVGDPLKANAKRVTEFTDALIHWGEPKCRL